jgi:FkbM family methyltransferase
MKHRVEFLAWTGQRVGKPPGWERVARWLAPPSTFSAADEYCLVRDGTLFLARPALPLGWHVLMFGSYEPELRAVFRAVLPAGGVVIDVGANVGWHTLLMAQVAGAGGRVIAVEANPHVRARLEEHLAINRCANVEVVPKALGDREGMVAFVAPPADDATSGDGHVAASGECAAHRIEVEQRRLDALAAERGLDRLDLLKIDVEGYEWPVLEGAEATIARFRPQVVFEHNANYLGRGGATPERLEEFCGRHRFRLFTLGRGDARAIAPGRWPTVANIWAVPRR